jgi:hypothetical protein
MVRRLGVALVPALRLTLALVVLYCGSLPAILASSPSERDLQQPSTTPREALVALYTATDGANWFRSDNWLVGEPCGSPSWWGVNSCSGPVFS